VIFSSFVYYNFNCIAAWKGIHWQASDCEHISLFTFLKASVTQYWLIVRRHIQGRSTHEHPLVRILLERVSGFLDGVGSVKIDQL